MSMVSFILRCLLENEPLPELSKHKAIHLGLEVLVDNVNTALHYKTVEPNG